MADRPILFSGPMVRALIAGTKTQTRRLPSFFRYRGFTEFGPSDTKGYDWHLRDSGMRWHDLRHSEVLGRLPWHYGDRLYVRETFSGPYRVTGSPPRDWGEGDEILYWADGDPTHGDWTKPKPGMHMPRWASRITLTVSDVRVERLQDISGPDALAEGIDRPPPHTIDADLWARMEYAKLWNSINGDGAWDANPWVAAYNFTVAMGNIDDLASAA